MSLIDYSRSKPSLEARLRRWDAVPAMPAVAPNLNVDELLSYSGYLRLGRLPLFTPDFARFSG